MSCREMTDPVLVLRSPTYRKALERAGIKQDDVDLWEVRPEGSPFFRRHRDVCYFD
jgi:hypothetical protein